MKRIKELSLNSFIVLYAIYFSTLFLDATSLVVDYPILEKVAQYARYLIYALWAIRLIFLLPDYKEMIFSVKWKDKPLLIKLLYITFVLLVISLVFCFLTTSYRKNLFTVFILICSLKVDYKKVFKTTMLLQIALTSLVLIICILGFTQDYIVYRGTIYRHSLGMAYTTFAPQLLLFASILYIYGVGSKVTLRELFEMQLANGLLYKLTNSRTEFFLLEFVIVVALLIKLLNRFNKEKIVNWAKKVYSSGFAFLFPILPLMSFIAAMGYPYGGIFQKLNGFLSNRLKQTYLCIVDYGIKPFGSKIEFLPFDLKHKNEFGLFSSNYVDNEYMHLLLTEGLVFVVCFVIIISILLLMLYKKKQFKEIILCSTFLIMGLLNPRISNLLYSPILFMILPIAIDYSKSFKKDNKEVIDNNKNKEKAKT